ncbi:hypothetical protein [Legionella moravica]|nr:hypothetical protein [Legionella moravica]
MFLENPTDRSDERAIKKASALYLAAVNASELPADKAYCQRKYASTIIRDDAIPRAERYQRALDALLDSIKTYEDYLAGFDSAVSTEHHNKVLIMELQRACVLLGHVALVLNQGDVLSQATEKLNNLLLILPNPDFKMEALTYSWHLNLSQNKISEARQNVMDSIEHCKEFSIRNITDYRHLAKINLLDVAAISDPEAKKSYFNEHVMGNFWKSFDEHKNPATPLSNQARNKAILKDFMIMFYAKIVQRLNNIEDSNPNETIWAYMNRQVLRVYKKSNPRQAEFVMNKVREGLAEIQDTGKISLAYNLFGTNVPSISLSPETFDALFPESKGLIRATQPTTIVAPVPLLRIGLFSFSERESAEEECPAASSSPVI